MFSIRLKELREQHGYSQAQLARKLGVGQSAVGMWENGANKPKNAKLEMLANLFNVSTDYLLGRDEEQDAPDGMTDDEREMWELREAARRDPDRRVLLKLAKNGTAQDVKQAVAIIDALRATNPDFYDGDDPA